MELLPLHRLTNTKDPATLRYERILPVAEPIASTSHRHDFFEVFLFRHGGGSHMVDFVEYPLENQSLHLVCPGQVHQVKRVPPSEGWVLMLSKDLVLSLPEVQALAALHQHALHRHACAVPAADYSLLEALFSQLVQAIEAGVPHPEVVRSSLSLVLLKSVLLLKPAEPEPVQATASAALRLARQFSGLVEQHCLAQHQVTFYADKLAITPGHLNVVSKAWLGKTAREVIQDRLLLEARRLLLHSEMATKEIAFHLGFEDPSHFSKFFKSCSNASPTDYRRQIREIYPR